MLANVPIARQVREAVNVIVRAFALTTWCVLPRAAAPAENLNPDSVSGSLLGSNALALVEEFRHADA